MLTEALLRAAAPELARRNWTFHSLPRPEGGSAYTMSEGEASLWQQAVGVPVEEADTVP